MRGRRCGVARACGGAASGHSAITSVTREASPITSRSQASRRGVTPASQASLLARLRSVHLPLQIRAQLSEIE